MASVPSDDLKMPIGTEPQSPSHSRPISGVAERWDLIARPFPFNLEPVARKLPSAAHIALVGNFPPQRCGLATFTADTHKALTDHQRGLRCDTYIMHDDDGSEYPTDITRLIARQNRTDYTMAARDIMRSGAELLLVEHEFGIFGGEDGDYVLDLIEAVDIPVAITLHTLLETPSPAQDAIMQRLIARADVLIVMAEYGRNILRNSYGVKDLDIAVIPHGIPDFAYCPPAEAKPQFGLEDKKTILTFGLLSHDKGIDRMIEAMPLIVQNHPDAVYVILGATHPNLVAQEGEALRKKLQARATELGVSDNIRWIDAFVELDELVEYLKAADVYVTPYLNPMQITSGTLSYAVGMGKPVVSTPYIHAAELLVNGNGALVPFGDSKALAQEIDGLLNDDDRRNAMAWTAYSRGRSMIWRRYADALLNRFDAIIAARAGTAAPMMAAVTAL